MVRVERHDIKNIQNFIKLGFESELSDLPSKPESALATWKMARGVQIDLERLAVLGSLVPAPTEVRRAIRIASDCIACLFSCGAGQPSVLIDGKPVAFDSVSDNSILNASEWIDAFYLGCIARRTENLDALCKIPLQMIRQSTTVDLDFRYSFVETLQAMHLKWPNPETGELLLSALEQTDPDQYILRAPDWVLSLDVEQLGLLGRFLSGDTVAFESALIKAVHSHKQFWSKKEDRRKDSTGFLSFPLTAIASLAYDNGFRFDLDSEYVPMWLVTGESAR